jgi:hypothetical protein
MDDKLAAYFERPDAPSAGSPTGKLIAQLVGKRPGISLAAAREEATRLLAKAAGRKAYRPPAVLTVEQEAAAKQSHDAWLKRLRDRGDKPPDMTAIAFPAHTSTTQQESWA